MLPASDANPEGFWERRDVNQLNDRILALFGGTWRVPPPLPACWLRDPRLDELRPAGGAILAELCSNGAPVLLKDPRFSFTAGFWKELAGRSQFVICVRDVVESAHSFVRLHGREPTVDALRHAANLWTRCTGEALRNTPPQERVAVRYADLLRDPERQIEHLLRCTIPEAADRPRLAAELRALVKPSLRRAHLYGGPTTDEWLPKSAAQLNEALAAPQAFQGGKDAETALRAVVEDLSRTSPRDERPEGQWQRQAEALASELYELETRVDEMQRWIETLQEGLDWHEHHRQSLETALRWHERHRAEIEQALAWHVEHRQRVEQELRSPSAGTAPEEGAATRRSDA